VHGRRSCSRRRPRLRLEKCIDESLHDGTGRTVAPKSGVGWYGHNDRDGDGRIGRGAKAINQSSGVLQRVARLGGTGLGGHVVLAGNPTPDAVPSVTTFSINGTITWAWVGVSGVFHTESL